MGAIDIGAAAIDRIDGFGSGATTIALDNPSNDTGTLDTVEIWAATTLFGTNHVATFSRDGSKFTPRDVATIGSVTAGSKQTFSGLDIDVVSGDYIGIYYSSGSIEAGSGGAGVYAKTGDYTSGGEETYSFSAGPIMSLYGTGETPSAPTVTTQAATITVPGGGTLNGNITNDNGGAITQHGFCWKSGSDPVNIAGADGSSELGAGSEGAFDQAKTGLTEATEFYYRAYAISSGGTGYGAAQSWTTGQTHSGVVAIAPAVGVAVEGNRLAGGLCQISPTVDVESIANYICTADCPITLKLDIESIANRICGAACPLDVELGLAIREGVWHSGVMQMTPGVDVSAAANVLYSGAAAIALDLGLAIKGNYITLAVMAIAIAVSQEALCTKVIDGGSVAITVDASVAAAAIRYLFTIIGYSGEFQAGSVLEIDSDNMTFILDGANAIKDIVGSFANVAPGSSTVTYEDDEGTRDVTLDLKYTPRDA